MEALIEFIKQIFSYLIKFIVIVGIAGFIFYLYDKQQSEIDQEIALSCGNGPNIWLLRSSPKSRDSELFYEDAIHIKSTPDGFNKYFSEKRDQDYMYFMFQGRNKKSLNKFEDGLQVRFNRRTFAMTAKLTGSGESREEMNCREINSDTAKRKLAEIQNRIESSYKL